GVSWRIVVPDLKAAWEAIERGDKPEMGQKGTSFRRWAGELKAEASNPERVKEMGYWEETLGDGEPGSWGGVKQERDTIDSAGQLQVRVPVRVTRRLLTEVPGVFHGTINDVLLTGLYLAVRRWRREKDGSQNEAVLVEVEGHGREEIFAGIDLTRTGGWVTRLYPVRLEVEGIDLEQALGGGRALGQAVKRIKGQLRKGPGGGLGYGMLRYLNRETGNRMRELSRPSIGFNYLGRIGLQAEEAGAWTVAWEWGGLFGGVERGMELGHILSVDAVTMDRAEGPEMVANWKWSKTSLREEDVRELAEGWFQARESLVRYGGEPGGGGL